MTRKYTMRSKEEKPAIVKEVLAGKSIRAWEPEIRSRRVSEWVKIYRNIPDRG